MIRNLIESSLKFVNKYFFLLGAIFTIILSSQSYEFFNSDGPLKSNLSITTPSCVLIFFLIGSSVKKLKLPLK